MQSLTDCWQYPYDIEDNEENDDSDNEEDDEENDDSDDEEDDKENDDSDNEDLEMVDV